MRFWKVILATLVIFGAGVITGALVVNLRYPEEARPLSVIGSEHIGAKHHVLRMAHAARSGVHVYPGGNELRSGSAAE